MYSSKVQCPLEAGKMHYSFNKFGVVYWVDVMSSSLWLLVALLVTLCLAVQYCNSVYRYRVKVC
jgi:hypothetical protein